MNSSATFPLLLLVYLVFYGIPSAGGFAYSATSSFIATLSLYAGAYLVEVFRACLAGVLRGADRRFPQSHRRRPPAAADSTNRSRRRIASCCLGRSHRPPISPFDDTSISSGVAVSLVPTSAELDGTSIFLGLLDLSASSSSARAPASRIVASEHRYALRRTR